MRRIWRFFAYPALIVAVSAGLLAPAAAEFFGSNDKSGQGVAVNSGDVAQAYAAYMHPVSSRPRITVRPRHRGLSPYATRHCRSWLAKEYRVSGPVIVPRMRCWWEQ